MENKDKNDEKEEKGSNSCVMDLSIDGGGEEKEKEIIINIEPNKRK